MDKCKLKYLLSICLSNVHPLETYTIYLSLKTGPNSLKFWAISTGLYTFYDFCNVYGSTLPAGTKLGSHAWVEGTEELGGLISYNWVLHTNSIVPHVHHFICSRTWIKLFEINKVFFSVGFSRGNFSLSIYHTYFIYSLAQILVLYRTVDLYDPAGMKKVTCSMTDSRL